ncbi:class I SAM-dependent methyltransferase [Oleispirillum naphthae]|uniref:class I SAM-dependent methyltransferase n=1 Tax=Oleispirillum naphthae TaxID=2838853 RepID=UPI003082288C
MREPDSDDFPPAGACAAHAPVRLNAVAVTNGFLPRPLGADFAWADFSCGNGENAAVIAAAYPQARCFAAGGPGSRGRALAEAAGLANLEWLSGAVAEIAEAALLPLDFAVFDGGLAGLATAERESTLARIARAVKPGGILLLGYHALPGFAAMMPLRDVLNSVTARRSGSPTARLRAALDWLAQADRAEEGFFADHAALRRRVRAYAEIAEETAAAELFSPTLTPFHFAQVNASMAAEGFTFAGNAAMRLNMLDLALPAAVRPLVKRARSRIEFETLRDALSGPAYRRDVYVRGAPVDGEAAFWAQHDALLVGLAVGDGDGGDGCGVDAEAFPFPLLREALAAGPCRVGGIPGLIPEIARDAVRVGLAAGMLIPFARAEAEPAAPQGDALRVPLALNRALLSDAFAHPAPTPLVSPVAGCALPVTAETALALAAIAETGCGFAEAEAAVIARLLAAANGRGGSAAGRAAIAALARKGLSGLTPQRLAAWARLGIVSG